MTRKVPASLRACLALLALPAIAHAQVVDSTLWAFSPGDRVLSIAPAGDTLYLGGSFLYVGPQTGGGVPVDAHSAQPLPRYPRVVGEVDAVVSDGAGGWFIGGRFPYVDALQCSNLAHIAVDGALSPWAPNANNRVWALARSGDTLFVGGDFDSIAGEPRGRIAAFSASTRTLMPWRCDADGRVSALLVSGSTVYAGGWFTTLGGESRTYVGAMETGTGTVRPWQVNLDDRVRALGIADTTLFLGGYFRTVNGEDRLAVAAVGSETGIIHAWDAQLLRTPITTIDHGPHVSAFLVSGNTLFVAGSFSSIGGQPRRGLAQIDLSTAQATSWVVSADYPRSLGPEFWALESSGDTLFVAGQFQSFGGQPGTNSAAASISSAQRLGWSPRANDYIFALALQGTAIYLGGWYTSIGQEWVARRGLAAIDARTGRVTDWNPNPNDYVKSLLAWGGKVYAGGYFSTIGGQPRAGIAALDPVTGQATNWNPGASGSVWTLQPLGDALLAGGIFTTIAGAPRPYLAAIDTATAQLVDWDPGASGDVYAVAVTDSAVYVGGDFTSFAGQPRASLAAVDARTGALLQWNPGADRSVSALATHGETIYVGGRFLQLDGSERQYLGAVDREGHATPWAPNPDGVVEALAASDSLIFAGGFFSGASATTSEWFVALDPVTAAVNRSFPTPNGPVWSLAAAGDVVYVGGGFGQIGHWPQESFAAIHFGGHPVPPESRDFELSAPTPNPVSDRALIRYALPASMPVTLTVYDLQGRTIARPIPYEVQSAGRHSISMRTSGWPAGCYLYRLDAGRWSAARKMVVLR